MKKILALILAVLTAALVFASCKTDPPAKTDPAPTTEPAPDTPTPVDPDRVSADFDVNQLYRITAADGTALESKNRAIVHSDKWEETVWRVENIKRDNGEVYSNLFNGDRMNAPLEAGTLVPGGTLKIGDGTSGNTTMKQQWFIRSSGNGNYKIVSAGNARFALTCEKGKFKIVEAADACDFTFEPIENQNAGPIYAEYVSSKGNITIRLPATIVDDVYKDVRRYHRSESEESLKERINDRLQLFAETTQIVYEDLIELTGFVPYNHLFVIAYEKQPVMAGVNGNDCNIYVNHSHDNESGGAWFTDDMIKMWRRWTDGKLDYNFGILHEMGHMFDWGRGWNFESEMQTDFKASYVLFKHRNEDLGAWAAPSEYAFNEIFNIDTIDTGAYHGLDRNPMNCRKVTVRGVEYYQFNYGIYRSAQMYVSFIKYCEKTEGLKGFEAMKEMFHWFQDSKIYQSANDGSGRQKLFNEKLNEFTGGDIDAFMLENYTEGDWSATRFNASDKKVKGDKIAGADSSKWYILVSDTE